VALLLVHIERFPIPVQLVKDPSIRLTLKPMAGVDDRPGLLGPDLGKGFLGKLIERLTASGLQVEPHDQSEHRSRFSYGWVNRLSTA
jgi:hypothetical protein